jgi:phosphopantetheinyl transferase (holo-ACP synthase)
LPVGNDVVDLRHPLCQPEAIHPRFDTRAFSASEIALLATSTQVHRTRWSLWAAKESAFKACRKLDSQVRFIPRDFEVHLRGQQAEVTHRLGHFEVWLDYTDQWVHALASQTGEKPGFRLDGDPSADPAAEEERFSERVKRLARSTLGALLSIAPSEVEIVSVDRIPQAQRRGEPLPFDLSLSHDGRFVSCAWESIRSSPRS